MKKFFCKTKIVLIILVLMISIGATSKVEAVERMNVEDLKARIRLKLTSLSIKLNEIKEAFQEQEEVKPEELPEEVKQEEVKPEELPEEVKQEEVKLEELPEKIYTENIEVGNKLKFTADSWAVYETKEAAQELDKTKKLDEYIKTGEIIEVKEKAGNVLKIDEGKYIYYGGNASKYFVLVKEEVLPEKIYTGNIKVGDKLKFTALSWAMYETKEGAQELDINKKSNEYIKNGQIIEVKEKYDNVLKIGDGKYIYYGANASRYFKLTQGEITPQPNNQGQQNGNIFTDSQGRKFKLYKQNGTEYNYVSYPARSSTIGKKGCGPVSCTIISSGYGYSDTPKSLVQTGKCYSCYDEIINYFKNKGFKVHFQYSMTNSEITGKLKDGYKIVVLSQKGKVGSYYLGEYSHWYTLLDYNTSTGKVFVGDPLVAGGGWFSLSQLTNRSNYICVKK